VGGDVSAGKDGLAAIAGVAAAAAVSGDVIGVDVQAEDAIVLE
jgi:hypothetical protein